MTDRRPAQVAIALIPGAVGAAIAFWTDPLSSLGAALTLTAALVVVICRPGTSAAGPIVVAAAAASILITSLYPKPADSSAGAVAVAEAVGLLVLIAAATQLSTAWHAIVCCVAAGAATSVLVLRLAEVSSLEQAAGMSLFGAVLAGVVAATGATVRRRGQLRQLRDLELRRARREELAKDLHDYLGHDLTAILVQAQAASVVRTRDREDQAVLSSIEGDATRALATLDRVVATLFGSSEPTAEAVPQQSATRPAPGLEDLPALVQRFNDTGTTPTELDDGTVSSSSLDPEIGTTIFRLVAEALTNIRRHAPAAPNATVVLRSVAADQGGSAILVEVTNEHTGTVDRPVVRSGSGVGLAGLRQRVELLGGIVEAGFVTPSRWQVRARFPVGECHG
ncbi:signal transduction histidine kinase [Kribbella amoyensis]|uniref:histidine kinase n=1 Tax=Kribbella amoyensis TaxID=996641 RepID=A0A561BV22_9ACTN|nr:histidine kinase [Kribbella amoyensis]TWD82764.1 signal transduction histidine kinase [Kribbella amoyensis]